MPVELSDDLNAEAFWRDTRRAVASELLTLGLDGWQVVVRTTRDPALNPHTGGLHLDWAAGTVTIHMPGAAAPGLSPAEQALAWADAIGLLAAEGPNPV